MCFCNFFFKSSTILFQDGRCRAEPQPGQGKIKLQQYQQFNVQYLGFICNSLGFSKGLRLFPWLIVGCNIACLLGFSQLNYTVAGVSGDYYLALAPLKLLGPPIALGSLSEFQPGHTMTSLSCTPWPLDVFKTSIAWFQTPMLGPVSCVLCLQVKTC